ncbi:MAG: DUF5667 domain-containing protein [Dehalococcoidales bacterium]|nr:DUF5667 domain-containing protein [Dehalococcoidales bacterium]
MNEHVEDCLAEAIDNVRSGACTVDEALARCRPNIRREVEPLLRLAVAIARPAHSALNPAFREGARARLLERMEETEDKPQPLGQVVALPKPWRQHRWRLPSLAAAAVLALVVSLGTGAAYASQGSLPGDPLYPVKTGMEQASVVLATSDDARASLYIRLAENRLNEMEALVQTGRAEVGAGLSPDVVHNLTAAEQMVERMSASGQDTSGYVERLQSNASQYESMREACGWQQTTPSMPRGMMPWFAPNPSPTPARAAPASPGAPSAPPTVNPQLAPGDQMRDGMRERPASTPVPAPLGTSAPVPSARPAMPGPMMPQVPSGTPRAMPDWSQGSSPAPDSCR